MRALVYDSYGPPENLRLEQMRQPEPKAGEVLVRVHAASLNSWDWDRLVGRPLGRVTSPFRPPHRVLGADIAGVVEAVGSGVDRFRCGDAVFGDLCEGNWGGFADYVCADAAVLAHKPHAISFQQAAALPQAGLLALQGLRLRKDVSAGGRLLLVGAGGGAGTFATQLAKRQGLHVTAVDKGEKEAAMLALGADRFIDYRKQDFGRSGDQYDLILDMVGSQSVLGYRRALASGGNVVLVGGSLGRILQVVVLGNRVGRRRSQRMELLVYRPAVAGLEELAALVASGEVSPIIDSVFPLEQSAAAFRRIGAGTHIGKIVIDMVDSSSL